MAIVIRSFDQYPSSYETDLARIYEDEPTFRGITSHAIAAIQEEFSQSGTVLYVAQFNDRWLAAATVVGEEEREIRLLCVRSATRLRGVGSRLIQEIKRRELANGCRRIFTYADPKNPQAEAFYSALNIERDDSNHEPEKLLYSIYSEESSDHPEESPSI